MVKKEKRGKDSHLRMALLKKLTTKKIKETERDKNKQKNKEKNMMKRHQTKRNSSPLPTQGA